MHIYFILAFYRQGEVAVALGAQAICSWVDENVLWVFECGHAEQPQSNLCSRAPELGYSVVGKGLWVLDEFHSGR